MYIIYILLYNEGFYIYSIIIYITQIQVGRKIFIKEIPQKLEWKK